MQIYLPIAELSLNIFTLLLLGGFIGFLSGLFGVGGGFIMTPLLILIGVPPTVAAATQANHVVASSVSGVLAHSRRGNVDFKMGGIMVAGGLAGSAMGVALFAFLRGLGQIDLVISLLYFILLTVVGFLMIYEAGRSFYRRKHQITVKKLHQHIWIHGLPFKTRFRKSRLYISALVPFGIGLGVGILSALMGVGGGFILIPLMIYLLGMPTSLVIGTSLFQIIFVAANVTFLQASQNNTVDIVLAAILIGGGVIGAQYGGRLAQKLPPEVMRLLLGILILGFGIQLLLQMIQQPVDLYDLGVS